MYGQGLTALHQGHNEQTRSSVFVLGSLTGRLSKPSRPLSFEATGQRHGLPLKHPEPFYKVYGRRSLSQVSGDVTPLAAGRTALLRSFNGEGQGAASDPLTVAETTRTRHTATLILVT